MRALPPAQVGRHDALRHARPRGALPPLGGVPLRALPVRRRRASRSCTSASSRPCLRRMELDWEARVEHVDFGLCCGLPEGKLAHARKGEVALPRRRARRGRRRGARASSPRRTRTSPAPSAIAEQVGIGAIVFNDLKRERIKDVVFDWEEILSFEGETGPYVQYTHARLASILRKAREARRGPAPSPTGPRSRTPAPCSSRLGRFPDVVRSAAAHAEPSRARARTCSALAASVNSWYVEHRVLGAGAGRSRPRASRWSRASKTVIANGLRLLGVGRARGDVEDALKQPRGASDLRDWPASPHGRPECRPRRARGRDASPEEPLIETLHPRRPRLPQEGDPLQGHHAAAAEPAGPARTIDRGLAQAVDPTSLRPRVRHRVARLHLRHRARARTSARASSRSASRASCPGRRPRSPTSSSTAPTRSRSTSTRCEPGQARADGRRPARDRRHDGSRAQARAPHRRQAGGLRLRDRARVPGRAASGSATCPSTP